MSPRIVASLNALVLTAALALAATGVAPTQAVVSTAGAPAPQPTSATSATSEAPSAAPSVSPAAPQAAPAEQPAEQPAAQPPPPPAEQPTPEPVIPRVTSSTGYAPYATVGPVVLHSPGDVVEVIGLHESSHDGAQPQSPVTGPARIGRLDERGRSTHPQGAADIVVEPAREVRSPVTGTVLRAGSYSLYCKHTDHYLVVEPDARPGWEVKVLHFEGLQVRPGDRVTAGVTRIGTGGRVLPFASQVDDHTASPHWPHLHVEVVDPAVPDRPGKGCP